MFSTSERSFGRSLLFSKDQIKDLKTFDRDLNRDVESLQEHVAGLEEALSAKRGECQRDIGASPQAEAVSKLSSPTKDIVEVELRLAKVQQYAAEQKKFEPLLDQREQAASAGLPYALYRTTTLLRA
jgi:Skp family chaperone for outer membrane proteins